MPQTFSNQICKICPYCNGDHLQHCPKLSPLSAEKHNSSTLLVFQAPGIDEWTGINAQSRAPISSNNKRSTADRMRKAFSVARKQRTDFDITEAVQCYPGKTNSGRDRKPGAKVEQQCLKHLQNDILNGHYTKIISFGKCANRCVEKIIKAKMLNVQHIQLAHPSSGRISQKQIAAQL